MYDYLDAAVVRAAAWAPGQAIQAWPDLTSEEPASWRRWLLQAARSNEGFMAAVEQSSPALAHRVQEICDGRSLPEPVIRRAVLSIVRYLLRASGRATPFGLLAGVAPARIGTLPARAIGAASRAVARPEAGWLTSVIDGLEAEPALQPHLMVVANKLVIERDGYLVLDHRPAGAAEDAPMTARLRATPPVRVVMSLAGEAIGAGDLAAKLAAGFPDVPADIVHGLLAELVRLRLLLTNLRPAMTATDPLGHLVRELAAVQAEQVAAVRETAAQLRELAGRFAQHGGRPTSADARTHRTSLAAAMTAINPTEPRLCLDLRIDGELQVPHAVAAEAAKAAGVLTRLARRADMGSAWVTWHGHFLERYGPRAVVPVLDAVDAGTGLGYPAGFLGAAPALAEGGLTDRDTTLLRLAQNAVLLHQREIVLDEALIADLATAAPDAPVQPTAELTVRIGASTAEALSRGEFTLTIVGVSRSAGTTTGRFLHLLNADERDRISGVYASQPTATGDALLAQISASPLYATADNIARAPQVLPYLLHVGEYDDAAEGRIQLEDLAVTADARRLYLISRSRGRPVEPVVLNAVEPVHRTHPLVRFLRDAPHALTVPCSAFDWGAAACLPFLPAVRYGRTILVPARWLVAATDLPGPAVSWQEWDDALAAWREQVGLPRGVHLGEGDRCLRLDLTVPAHRALVRAQLDRAGTALLRAVTADEEAGWVGGRAHEIVIPVASTAAPVAPPAWLARPAVSGRDHGHLPGCDGRFYLKLYGPPTSQDTVLVRHLPELLTQLGDQAQWWFLRYRDPDPHLRLRLKVPADSFADTAAGIGTWTKRLRRAGLLARVEWDTYFPETARFGGDAAMGSAEDFFAADAAATLAQLAASATNDGADVRALTAASMLDLAVSSLGEATTAMDWLIAHAQTPSPAPAPARALYDQAVALANPIDHSALAEQPGGGNVVACWTSRRRALLNYRRALEQANPPRLPDLLPDLLHLHHARMIGTDTDSEAVCLRLARAAALSWKARTTRNS